MNIPPWVWILTVGLTGAVLLVDVVIIGRRPHVPSMAEAGRYLAMYVVFAVLFGVGVWYFSGADFAAQYYAGWLTREAGSDDDEFKENRILKWVESRFPATNQWQGTKLAIRSNGSRIITPMFIVILALGTTDLLFALDSIPAIFGLTQEPFLVLTANIFALMGLRQLYFLIGGLLKRLVYLGIGLAFLLSFIGIKLILHAAHVIELPFINDGHPVWGAPDISIGQSLTVIIVILAITTIASLLKSRKDNAVTEVL